MNEFVLNSLFNFHLLFFFFLVPSYIILISWFYKYFNGDFPLEVFTIWRMRIKQKNILPNFILIRFRYIRSGFFVVELFSKSLEFPFPVSFF